ncbi:MAG: hypothetical protein JKY93_03265 [Gammaproteobacteria bacterium]|nr:hypothetical protein [Gammaproteobacteria bacterium]
MMHIPAEFIECILPRRDVFRQAADGTIVALNAGVRVEFLEHEEFCAHHSGTKSYNADTIKAEACSCNLARGASDFEASELVYVLTKGTCFSLCEAKAEHGNPDAGDQNIVMGRSHKERPHQDDQANKSHSRIPFFIDKFRNAIQRLASKCFHPVFPSNSGRVVEGGEFVVRRPHLEQLMPVLSSTAVLKHADGGCFVQQYGAVLPITLGGGGCPLCVSPPNFLAECW